MKVKVLSRDPEQYQRKTKEDIHRVQTNVDPKLHPLEAAREYKRAVNAVKLERVFAKPFLGQLDGHRDGVHCMVTHPKRLGVLLSGSADGDVRIWNLATKKCIHNSVLHAGFVRGICVTPLGDRFITVGQDKTIKIARMDQFGLEADPEASEVEAPMSIVGRNFFTAVDHHRRQDMFVTSGPEVELWSPARSEPLRTLTWGIDTVNCIRFNPVEVNVVASAGDDRSIVLYDVRMASPLRKLEMEMRTNSLKWNPMEAFNFTIANEDHNCYTFDMRKLSSAKTVHKDHVSAVMDLDFSPTGKEFVTASYDCSMRIFGVGKGHSREVYHTKRMQRIFCVKWSADNRYICTGSDETNIRLWKSTAWEHIGTKAPRQAASLNYSEKLKQRFKHHPEVKRIARHRHVPKAIYKAKAEKAAMEQSAKRKEENRRKHSKKGKVPFTAERKKRIVAEME